MLDKPDNGHNANAICDYKELRGKCSPQIGKAWGLLSGRIFM